MKDTIYSGQYQVISKIGTEGTNSTACREFIQLVKRKKEEKGAIIIAEIGTDIGATTVEVCKQLDANDVYYCFDYEDKVEALISDLKLLPEVNCQLMAKGNSHKTLDSYSWSLCKMLFEMRNNNSKGIFDLVYLDGSHSFIHDGLSCCILKELLKDKGIIIFDDMYWSYEKSPTCNPKAFPGVTKLFTEEQIKDCQVKRVVEAFMTDDKRFKQIYIKDIDNNARAIFQKD